MKSFLLPVYLFLAVAAFADPSAEQLAFVKKYDGKTFSTQGLTRLQEQSNGWTQYRWTEGRSLWNNTKQDAWAVVEKSGVEIYRYSKTAYEYHFPEGRIIKSDPTTGKMTWNPLVGEPAPDFDLPVLGGSGRVKLSSLKGSVVLLDFWASWCGPCQQYLPGTEALHQKYQGEGLKVFGINIEGDARAAQANARQLKLTFPSLMAQNGPGGPNWDSVQIADYGIDSIPRGVLIDKQGIIRASETVFSDEVVLAYYLAN